MRADICAPQVSFHIQMDDLDGSANGAVLRFRKKEISLKLPELTGDKNIWYAGKALKTIDFKLKKK